MGRRVLLVDLDPQANATSGLGFDPQKLDSHMYHVVVGAIAPAGITKKTSIFGLELLPASYDLAGASVELVSSANREFRLREVLAPIEHEYHYIILDSPPSLDLLTINGLVASHEIIIPVQCEYFALEGLGQLLRTIWMISDNLKHPLRIAGALLTMYDKRNVLAREIVKEMRRNFPGNVFEAVIPRSVVLAEAPQYGKTIIQYAPESLAAKAYRQLAQEIIKMETNI
jgi:chromosome partitioning protein